MDFTPIITIIASAIVIFFFVKLVVSPLIKVAIGVVIFFIIIYILKHFLNFDLSTIFGPFGKYLDPGQWGVNLNEAINQIKNYFKKL